MAESTRPTLRERKFARTRLALAEVAAQHLEGSGTARFWLRHPNHGEWKEPGYPGPDLPIILGVMRPPAVSGAE